MAQSQAPGESLEGRSITRLSLDLVALEGPRFQGLSLEVSPRDVQFLSLPDRRKAGIAKLLHLGVKIRPGIIRDPGSRCQPDGETGGRQVAPGSGQRESGHGV